MVAAIMLDLSSMATLALYEKAIVRLTRLWPSAWHLVAAADDKCGAEPIKRIRRSCEVKRVSGKDVPNVYSVQEPWSIYFRLAAADTAFGDGTGPPSSGGVGDGGLRGASLAPDENVPAPHLPGGPPALEPQLERSRTDRRKQHEVTEQRRAAAVQGLQQLRAWRQARIHTGGSAGSSPGKVTNMGHEGKKGKSNLHSKTRDGKKFYNSGDDVQDMGADVAPKTSNSGISHCRQGARSRSQTLVGMHTPISWVWGLLHYLWARVQVRFTVSEALQRRGCRLPQWLHHCCPLVCPMFSCARWFVLARALSRRSSGDREGIREGPRVEEAGPVSVHLLGRRHLLPRAGRFEALWGKSAGGSGGVGLRGPVAEWVGTLSRDGRQRQSSQAVKPEALSISRVRPRALLAGRLCQHKLALEPLACPSASALAKSCASKFYP